MGTEFQFHKTKYGGHGGDGRMTMTIYLIPLSWTLRNGKFYVTCILLQKRKTKEKLKDVSIRSSKKKNQRELGEAIFFKVTVEISSIRVIFQNEKGARSYEYDN